MASTIGNTAKKLCLSTFQGMCPCILFFSFLFLLFKKWEFWCRTKQNLSYNVNLRSKNGSTSFEEEREVTGKVEASSKPPTRRNVELSSTLVNKRLGIENGILESNCIQRFPISNCSKLQDGYTMRSRVQGLFVFAALSIFSFNNTA